jgi:hypothetical protein
MTHGAARPPGSHELHEVEAVDGRGDESHRDLEGTEQTARHEVRQRQQHRSAPEGRQDAEPRDTREPPGDLRGGQSEESDRPGRRHAGGGENDTVADQHDSCAPGPQSETGGGVVPPSPGCFCEGAGSLLPPDGEQEEDGRPDERRTRADGRGGASAQQRDGKGPTPGSP